MRNLGIIVMVGTFALAAGCDSGTTTAPPPPDSGGDAKVADSSSGGSDVAVADANGGGSDVTVVDVGNDAPVADSTSGGNEAAVGDSGGGDATAVDAGEADAKVIDGGGSDAGSCVLPSCLTNLEANCTPSGSCDQYYDENTGNTYSCYPNGVKRSDIIPTGEMNTTITVENATATCYTIVYSASDVNNGIGPTSAIVANKADAGVAVVTMGADGNTWTVTCDGGGKAVTLDPSCINQWPVSWLINGPPSQADCNMVSTCSM